VAGFVAGCCAESAAANVHRRIDAARTGRRLVNLMNGLYFSCMTSGNRLWIILPALLFGASVLVSSQAPTKPRTVWDGVYTEAQATRATGVFGASCAGCHTLDRVNNKKADGAAWTTTVARMKGAGANMTDEQVPLVAEYLTRAAGTLAVAPLGELKGKGGAPAAAKGKGGGGGGKNIQVLQGADIPATMQSFVQALGLLDKGTCNYCPASQKRAHKSRSPNPGSLHETPESGKKLSERLPIAAQGGPGRRLSAAARGRP
jgi:mono/diheme cytochrome c family protein